MMLTLTGLASAVLWGFLGLAAVAVLALLVRLLVSRRCTARTRKIAQRILAGRCAKDAGPAPPAAAQDQELPA